MYACMYMCIQVSVEARNGVRPPGAGITDSCKAGQWELNLGPLQVGSALKLRVLSSLKYASFVLFDLIMYLHINILYMCVCV